MSNFRIIYDNAADRAALSASSTAGALGVDGLQTDIKSDVWRAAGTAATITATWPAGERIAGVHLPYTNLSSGATMRVRGFVDPDDAEPSFDTGLVFACPALALGLWEWGSTPLGANSFAYGGGAHGRVWFERSFVVRKLEIEVVDTWNLAGYIEAGRLVCGRYWAPDNNADYGAPLTPVDLTTQFRNGAGDLMSDRGTRHRKQAIDLSMMTPADRAQFWNIVWGNGMSRPMLFSLYPNDPDPRLEQMHQLYCKLVSSPAMNTPNFLRYTTQLEFEEV